MSSNSNSTTEAGGKAAALVPERRFPEFAAMADWDAANGNELFQQINNREAPPGLPILAITQEHGAIPRDLIDYHVSVTEQSVESYKEVKPGDFIISLRSFQGGIEYSKYHGICSPAYVILRKRVDVADEFFKQHFKSHRFIQQLARNLEGLRDGKMISYKQFSQLRVLRPSLPEQQRIADCLASADMLIEAQRRKVEALRAQKKGMMQQLFPRPERIDNGIKIPAEPQPRLRFPEFEETGDWQESTLAAACHMQAGKFAKASEIQETSADGLFPCYGGNGLRGYTASFTHSGRYPLIGRQGALCGNVKFVVGEFHATEHALVATPKSGVSVDWLFYLLDYLDLNQFATGQAQPGLSVDVLNNVMIPIPRAQAEQQHIADCLISLDDLISAEVQKLDTLKTHKKGLMQQLFPRVGEAGA